MRIPVFLFSKNISVFLDFLDFIFNKRVIWNCRKEKEAFGKKTF